MGNSYKNRGNCPRHGSKYMENRDGAYYCTYSTPDEMTKICFHHSNQTKGDNKPYLPTDPNPNYQPNVMKVISENWGTKKYITRRTELL